MDFSVFALFSLQGFSVLVAHTIGRIVAIAFNYPLAKKMVFHCQTKDKYQFSKYITLVPLNCIISFLLINFFISYFSASPIIIKILKVDVSLFLSLLLLFYIK
ncbi:GtrA family protein [Legionella gratiana]|uniref:GtrA family protein n=1 Tax=Legionella gratiana TaxID=45066 RepID=UPI000A598B48